MSVPAKDSIPAAVSEDETPADESPGFTAWIFSVLKRADLRSYGYIPFALWLMLLFGGIWFPATGFLKFVFEGEPLPDTEFFGPEMKKGQFGPLNSLITLPFCLLFWAWTNLAFLCLMASAMGEVSRWKRDTADVSDDDPEFNGPDYRAACTRAFFVYLFTLLNEVTVAGSLTMAGAHGQSTYTRIAILSSLFCFVASYRPDFFDGLVNRFGAGQTALPAHPPKNAK